MSKMGVACAGCWRGPFRSMWTQTPPKKIPKIFRFFSGGYPGFSQPAKTAYQHTELFEHSPVQSNACVGRFWCADVFRYLGSHVHWTLSDEFDIQHRISAASAAFGALSSTLCSRRVNSTLRGQIYSTLVCSILLYGSECWALSQALVQQLQAFHNKCVRRMCFVTLQHCHLHRISAATLDACLKLTGIQTTIDSLDSVAG